MDFFNGLLRVGNLEQAAQMARVFRLTPIEA